MRVIGSLFLSILIAIPALAQIGARTGKPTLGNTKVTQAEAQEAGQENASEVDLFANNTTNVRMEVDPANEGEEEGACLAAIGRLPTLKKGEPGDENRTKCFWNQKDQEYLKYARFINSSKTAGVAMDVVSDTLGPFRLVFSTAVAANTNDDDPSPDPAAVVEDEPTADEDRALNLLAANGGNLAITAALPLYFKPIGNGSFLWNSYARLGGNIQAFGSGETELTASFGDTNANLELAFSEFQLDLLTQQERFNLLGYAKTSAVIGTEKFAASIGDPSRAFLHGQIGAGIRIVDRLQVYLSYNWYSDDRIPGGGGAITFTMSE